MEGPTHPQQQMARITYPIEKIEGTFNIEDSAPVSLMVLSPVSPGQTAQIDFTLINDDARETAEYTLYTTDLVGMSGHIIPKERIIVSPNSGRIPPGESLDGRIEILVPIDMPQGDYGGLLRTEDVSQLQASVQLVVSSQERSGL